jgi:hypothetical protein
VKYKVQNNFSINVGFSVASQNIFEAVGAANRVLDILPASLYRCLDFKTVSSMVGAIFCEELATERTVS